MQKILGRGRTRGQQGSPPGRDLSDPHRHRDGALAHLCIMLGSERSRYPGRSIRTTHDRIETRQRPPSQGAC